jgi:hypothetical protein
MIRRDSNLQSGRSKRSDWCKPRVCGRRCGQRYLVGPSGSTLNIQRDSRTDSRFFGILPNRLAILWFIDSQNFGAVRKINDLVDSHLVGPDNSIPPRNSWWRNIACRRSGGIVSSPIRAAQGLVFRINPLIGNEDPVGCISPGWLDILGHAILEIGTHSIWTACQPIWRKGLSRSHRRLRHEILCPRRLAEPSRVSLRLQRACDRYFAGRDRNRGSGRREGPGDTRQLQGKQGGDWRRHRCRSCGGSDSQRIQPAPERSGAGNLHHADPPDIEYNGAPNRQELRPWPTPNCNCETQSSTSAAG